MLIIKSIQLKILRLLKLKFIYQILKLFKKNLKNQKKKLLSQKEIDTLEKSLETLNLGKRSKYFRKFSNSFLSQIGLLSLKPKIIVCNVDEENFNKGNEHTKN